MSYIFLCFAVLCFAAQFAFNKVYEGSIKQTTATALVLPLVIGIIGVIQCAIMCGFSITLSPISLILAFAMALAFIPCYVLGIKVLNLGSLAIYSMFMMLGGMLVPYFYGIIFLNEGLTEAKGIGCILLTAFIVMQAIIQNESMAKNKSGTKKERITFLALCIAIFFLNGMTGVIAKIHEISAGAVSEANFTFLYSLVTALVSLVLLLFLPSGKEKGGKAKEIASAMAKKPLFSMIGLGIMTNTGNFLLLKAAAKLPASVQFPFTSGGVILLSALVSALVFREKLVRKEWLAVLGASAATILFLF